MTLSPSDAAAVGADEFARLFEALTDWGRPGQRGALRHLTADRVTAAAKLVRDGVRVTLSLPLAVRAAPDSPEPAVHR